MSRHLTEREFRAMIEARVERRDSILARIAEILPRPDGGSTGP